MAWPKTLTAAQQAHNERQKVAARGRLERIVWLHRQEYSVKRIARRFRVSESRIYELLRKARVNGLYGG